MSITAASIPAQTRKSTRKPRLTPDELKTAITMLKKGETPSNGVLYTEGTKSGNQGPRTVAYEAGFAVRREVMAAEPSFTSETLSVVTWPDGDGYRWALKVKEPKAAKPASKKSTTASK